MIDYTDLMIGFAANLLVAILIVRFIYYPANQNKNFVFTFIAFNTAVYFVMSVLTHAELSVGVGFGLFGLFSLLRYRTQTMPTREMTYLFVIIALPVLNAFMIAEGAWVTVALSDAAVIAVLFLLEREWGFRYELSRVITYERIELIKPENYAQLLADLRTRTGLAVNHCEVGEVNFLRDTAEVTIYYDDPARAAKAGVRAGMLDRMNVKEARGEDKRVRQVAR